MAGSVVGTGGNRAAGATAETVGYTVAPQGDILSVRMGDVAMGWQQWFLLTSDWHWDSPYCDRATLKRHLEQAQERGAGIFCFGDLFDAMGGKYDPRSDKKGVRPEHQVSNYLDALVDTAAEWIKPYAGGLIGIGLGNHETSIEKHHETDLAARVAKCVGTRALGYAGFVRFMFCTVGNIQSSRLLYWTHGSGGAAPVTKGVIDTARKAVWLPDADIVCRGHNHHSWVVPQTRLRISNKGTQFMDEQLHLDLGVYKQEFDLRKGYAIEKGFSPVSVGGVWLRFAYDGVKPGRIGMEAVLAR